MSLSGCKNYHLFLAFLVLINDVGMNSLVDLVVLIDGSQFVDRRNCPAQYLV